MMRRSDGIVIVCSLIMVAALSTRGVSSTTSTAGIFDRAQERSVNAGMSTRKSVFKDRFKDMLASAENVAQPRSGNEGDVERLSADDPILEELAKVERMMGVDPQDSQRRAVTTITPTFAATCPAGKRPSTVQLIGVGNPNSNIFLFRAFGFDAGNLPKSTRFVIPENAGYPLATSGVRYLNLDVGGEVQSANVGSAMSSELIPFGQWICLEQTTLTGAPATAFWFTTMGSTVLQFYIRGFDTDIVPANWNGIPWACK